MKITIIKLVPGHVFQVGKTYSLPNHQAHALITGLYATPFVHGQKKKGGNVQPKSQDAADT